MSASATTTNAVRFPPGSKHRQTVFDELGAVYDLNDLGTVKFTLGAKVVQQPRLQTISINQTPFIDDIVAKFGDDLGESRSRQRVVCPSESKGWRWSVEILKTQKLRSSGPTNV
ncbi:hypothetical protein AB1Y20_003124 [Prymnesium parvum]|uniref:Reverse transcriptase Ty1/copia-type domain-containing protein n=1 Tax=Prymnesium parvum TaxID=97485 RepID=A0AB34JCI3_PRYPA